MLSIHNQIWGNNRWIKQTNVGEDEVHTQTLWSVFWEEDTHFLCVISHSRKSMGRWTLGPSSLCSEKALQEGAPLVFFYRKQFSCPCVLWSSSYPCCITPLLLTWGNWASSLAFWPALILPCHFARRCSLLSGALAQQPQRALALCGPHCITLLAITALRALHGAILSACALCYNCACSQLHCFAGDDNT